MTLLLAGNTALILLALAASWLDVAFRKLPNWLSILTLVVGVAVTIVDAGPSALGSHLAHALLALLVGMILFRFGVVGGGDAKFYAAVASWFGLSAAAGLLLTVSLSGLLIFVGWFIWRRMRGKPVRAPSSASNSDKLPYGIAIAAGAIVQYFQPFA